MSNTRTPRRTAETALDHHQAGGAVQAEVIADALAPAVAPDPADPAPLASVSDVVVPAERLDRRSDVLVDPVGAPGNAPALVLAPPGFNAPQDAPTAPQPLCLIQVLSPIDRDGRRYEPAPPGAPPETGRITVPLDAAERLVAAGAASWVRGPL